jgi:hypothetical protein
VKVIGLDLSIGNVGMVLLSPSGGEVLYKGRTGITMKSSISEMTDFANRLVEEVFGKEADWLVVDFTTSPMRGRKGQEKVTGLFQGVVLGVLEQYIDEGICLVEPAQLRASLSLSPRAKKEEVWKASHCPDNIKNEHARDAYSLAYVRLHNLL